MNGASIGFIGWVIVGCVIIGIGIAAIFSKKPVGFWANTRPAPMKDQKRHNRATGLLFICYGLIFAALGIPLAAGQNTAYVLLSVVGVMVETIVCMAVYSLVIEKRYKE